MISSLYSSLFWIIGALITSMGAFIMKSIIMRIETLEQQIKDVVSESQVRQIIADKMDPIHQDVQEVKEQLQQFLTLYLQDRSRK